jgi:hypothetical protein
MSAIAYRTWPNVQRWIGIRCRNITGYRVNDGRISLDLTGTTTAAARSATAGITTISVTAIGVTTISITATGIATIGIATVSTVTIVADGITFADTRIRTNHAAAATITTAATSGRDNTDTKKTTGDESPFSKAATIATADWRG